MTYQDLLFLRGVEFSNDHDFHSIRNFGIQSRLEILKSVCTQKRAIHLGAADHQGLIANKIAAGIWLHGVVTNVAKECIGVDIDAEVVAYVCENHNIANMISGNIFDEEIIDSFRSSGPWDVMLLGEILERIPNPVQFLADIRDKYNGIINEVIITVPNALRISNFFNTLRDFEAVNTDHKYWFTPYTVASVVAAAGLTPQWVASCHYVWESPRRQFLRRFLQRRFPFLRDCLVMNATL